MISLSEFYMNRDVKYKTDLTPSVTEHAKMLLEKVNEILTHFGSHRGVNSGWRPKQLQMEINPRAPNSKHITGDAIDLEDKDGELKSWCMANQLLLASVGLYMEDPNSTPSWCHLQQVPPKSGKIVFKP